MIFTNFAVMFTDSTWKWIYDNIDANPDKLRLKHAGNSEMMKAIDQIDCRRRAALKLHNTLECKRFTFPGTLSAEQCTSDALADYHAKLIAPDSHVLDMTCGLGIDSFAMARRCRVLTACEINGELAAAARHNAICLGINNISVECVDSVEYLQRSRADEFDCIFIDPARRGTGGQRLFGLADCHPNVVELLPKMLEVAPNIIIKASPMIDVSHTLAELTDVVEIVATGNERECKELLLVCRRNTQSTTPRLAAMTMVKETESIYAFTREHEQQSTIEIGTPEAGMIMYEPYAPVMKMGPFKSLCADFKCKKFDISSHYYFSDGVCDAFPGRAYNILECRPFNKRCMSEIGKQYKELDVSARNFPLTAAELTKRLKVKPSGRYRLIATRCEGELTMVICESM